MKNFYSIAASALMLAMLVGFTSCTTDKRNILGTLMTQQSDINNAVAIFGETFTDDDVITKVVFEYKQDDGVTKYAGALKAYVYEKGNDSLQVCVLPLLKGAEKAHVTNTYAPGYQDNKVENGVKFADIDFSKIAGYITKAGEMVDAANDEYEEEIGFSGVSDYEMTFEKDAKNAVHKFNIESKDDDASTSNMDRFWEFAFEVKNGELIAEDLE